MVSLSINMSLSLRSIALLPAGLLLLFLVPPVLDEILGSVQLTTQPGPFSAFTVLANKGPDEIGFPRFYSPKSVGWPFALIVPLLPTLLCIARTVLLGDLGPRQGGFWGGLVLCACGGTGVAWRRGRRVEEGLVFSGSFYPQDNVLEFLFFFPTPIPASRGSVAMSRHDGYLLVDVRLELVMLMLMLKLKLMWMLKWVWILVMMDDHGAVGLWMVHHTAAGDVETLRSLWDNCCTWGMVGGWDERFEETKAWEVLWFLM